MKTMTMTEEKKDNIEDMAPHFSKRFIYFILFCITNVYLRNRIFYDEN